MHRIEERSILTSILLSIITCNIYGWVWVYRIWSDLYAANDLPNEAGKDLVLSLVTCGIYYIYMFYKAGKLESAAFERHGLPRRDEAAVYVLLGIFFTWMATAGVLQHNLNTHLADVVNR